MRVLVGERGVVGHVLGERSERRHLNVIGRGRVEGLVSAVAQVGPDGLKETLSVCDALGHGNVRVLLGCVPINLSRVEHAVTAREQQARTAGEFRPAILRFRGLVGELPERYRGSLLALADLCALVLPLLVRGPFAPLVSFGLRRGPQTHGIDAAVWLLARYVDGRECEPARSVPWHAPVPYTLLDCVDDLGRHARVNVPFVGRGMVDVGHREMYLSRCLGARRQSVAVPIRSNVRFGLVIEH
jgi:hypothetical protein